MSDSHFAFVLMPFSSPFDDVYKLGIKEPLESLDIRTERVDEQTFHKETILERIYNHINAADFIVADMTGRNPNVFYEVGYAHAKKKTCILLTSSADDIPFDLKQHRHIVYPNIRHLKDGIRTEAAVVVDDIKANKLRPTRSVEKDYWHLRENELFCDWIH